MDPALRALNRFGLGARPGERTRLRDPRAWLHGQLDPEAALLSDPGLPSVEAAADSTYSPGRAAPAEDREVTRGKRRPVDIFELESHAALTRRVTTDAPFLERLVAFWSNHLCVSIRGRAQVLPLAGQYEREVVRTHVLGRFTDMVLASARHPAMLFYLDNVQSIGPDSPAAQRAARRGGRQRGLNENYARELMELHTLGVDGGYTQQDVIQVARAFTGWTVSRTGRAQEGGEGFAFRQGLHEPGVKVVLGKNYDEAGAREGEAVIRTLCAHPATARFVSAKLVRHFVSDDPPASAVDAVAKVFLTSGGDLRTVSAVLVDLDEAWRPESRKLRTPQDWLVAVLRAVDARKVEAPVAQVLRQLHHPLWSPASPKGYSDLTRDWADPDSLMQRADLARALSERVARAGGDPTTLLDLLDVEPDDPIQAMLADGTIAPDERVALVFGGPAFQWR